MELKLSLEPQGAAEPVDVLVDVDPAATVGDLARALVEAASSLLDGAEGGTHHLSGNPDTSWADLAREIMAQAALPCRIDDIPTSAYPTPARRPLNSRLDCSLFDATFGIPRPDWRAGLSDILKDLTQ